MPPPDDERAPPLPSPLIPPGEPEKVQELVRRELEQVRLLFIAEAQSAARLESRRQRLSDLLRFRRSLRAEVGDHEKALLRIKTELAEVEREIEELRLPPGLAAKD